MHSSLLFFQFATFTRFLCSLVVSQAAPTFVFLRSRRSSAQAIHDKVRSLAHLRTVDPKVQLIITRVGKPISDPTARTVLQWPRDNGVVAVHGRSHGCCDFSWSPGWHGCKSKMYDFNLKKRFIWVVLWSEIQARCWLWRTEEYVLRRILMTL